MARRAPPAEFALCQLCVTADPCVPFCAAGSFYSRAIAFQLVGRWKPTGPRSAAAAAHRSASRCSTRCRRCQGRPDYAGDCPRAQLALACEAVARWKGPHRAQPPPGGVPS